jgi:hypothetical protein
LDLEVLVEYLHQDHLQVFQDQIRYLVQSPQLVVVGAVVL